MSRLSRIRLVRQHDITDCGPACVVSVAAAFGSHQSISRIRQLAGTDQRGTSAYGLIRVFEQIGFSAKGIRSSREGLCNLPRPSILHISTRTGQHYVVFAGIGRRYIRIMNPSTGRIEKQLLDEFCEKWSGIAIIVAPGKQLDGGDSSGVRRRFLALLRPHRGVLFQVFLGSVITTLLGFSTSVFIQKLTDLIIVYELRHFLHLSGIALMVIILFQLLLGVVKSRMILRTGQMIDSRLMMGYFGYLLKLPQQFFDTMRTGEIISRINDAAKIRQFLSETLTTIVLNILIVVFSILLLLAIHPALALIVAIVIPVYFLIYMVYNSMNKRQEREVMERSAEVESQLVETLRNMRTTKLLNLGEMSYRRVEVRFISFLDALFRSGRNFIFSHSASEFTNRTINLVMLWSGAMMVFSRELTLGQLLSFYAILGYMTGPAASLVGISKTIQNARIAADRLFQVFDLEAESSGGGASFSGRVPGGIVFRDVGFSYGTRGGLFEGLSLSIPGSALTLIVGASGSGKSTLAHLITGLYPIDSGRIEIGGRHIKEYSVSSLRASISVVPQHTELFSGSLLSNISGGDFDADFEKARMLCDRLQLGELIMSLPSGLHTEIGENGITFSGGERQRISIARALYRDPSILILDEAMSSLDGVTSGIIRQVVEDERKKGTMVIMITHHTEGIDADHMICMDRGRVIYEGSSNEAYTDQDIQA